MTISQALKRRPYHGIRGHFYAERCLILCIVLVKRHKSEGVVLISSRQRSTCSVLINVRLHISTIVVLITMEVRATRLSNQISRPQVPWDLIVDRMELRFSEIFGVLSGKSFLIQLLFHLLLGHPVAFEKGLVVELENIGTLAI